MSIGPFLIISVVSIVVGLTAIYFLLKAVTDRLFRKQEELLRSVQLMVNTLSLQRDDNAAMLLAAQMLRAQSDGLGIEPLPFEDKLPPAKGELP